MREKPVLRVISKMLVGPIILFSLYVQFHGDFGPGGGFQAGVIFASAFIVYALIYGNKAACAVAPPHIIRLCLMAGVLIYAGTGVAGLMLGGNYLNYSVLLPDPLAGQHLGIIVIEWGVGMTVATAMIMIFYTFASYRADKRNGS